MRTLIFLAATSALGLAALRLAQWLVASKGSERALVLGLLWLALTVMVTQLVGGLLQSLTPLSLLAASLAVCAVTYLLVDASQPPDAPKDAVRPISLFRSPLSLACLGLCAVAWLLPLVLGLAQGPRAGNELTRYMLLPALWVSEQRLHLPSLPHLSPLDMYGATQLLNAWSLTLLGRDSLAAVVQLPFSLLGMLALYHLARAARATPRLALAAPLLFIATPQVMAQSSLAYTDVAFAGGLFVLCAAGAGVLHAPNLKTILVYGLALGLSIGIKPEGLMWPLLVTALVLGLLITLRHSVAAHVSHVAAFVGACLIFSTVLGGAVLARNVLSHGNPVHPWRVAPLGITLFSGEADQARVDWRSSVRGRQDVPYSWWNAKREMISAWRDYDKDGYYYDTRRGGLGPQWLLLQLPALPFALFMLYRRREWYLFGLVTLFSTIMLLSPSMWWTRLALPLLAAGGIAFVVCLCHAMRPTRWVLQGALILAVLYSMYVLLGTGQGSAWLRTDLQHVWTGSDAPALHARYLPPGMGEDSLVQWLPRHAHDAVVLVDGTANTPLYWYTDPHQRNRLVYLDATDYDAWRTALDNHGVEFVVIDARGNPSPAHDWIEQRPEAFLQVFASERERQYVYLVRSPAREARFLSRRQAWMARP